MVISEKTVEFLKGRYIDNVQNFLDDPDGMCETVDGVKEHYELLLHVGVEIGLNFWDVAKEENSKYEIDRLKTILGKA